MTTISKDGEAYGSLGYWACVCLLRTFQIVLLMEPEPEDDIGVRLKARLVVRIFVVAMGCGFMDFTISLSGAMEVIFMAIFP